MANQPSQLSGPLVLLGRLCFSLIFLMAGFTHFSSGSIAYAVSKGVPMASIVVPLSGVISLVGALSIILGYRARLGAWLIVVFLVCVTPAMHRFWGVTNPMTQQIQMAMFIKNLSMLGGAFLITQFGSGPFSLKDK